MKFFLYSLFSVSALVAVAQSANAQSLRIRPSFEISTGTAVGHGGYYAQRDLGPGVRLAGGVTVVRNKSFGGFVDLAVEASTWGATQLTFCRPNPHGGCLEDYPPLGGVTGIAGVLARPSTSTEIRVGAGGGRFMDGAYSAGGFVAQADIGAFVAYHVGVFAGVRTVIVPKYRGERLEMTPWFVGLRVR